MERYTYGVWSRRVIVVNVVFDRYCNKPIIMVVTFSAIRVLFFFAEHHYQLPTIVPVVSTLKPVIV